MLRSLRRSVVRTAAAGTAVVAAVEATTNLPSQGRSSEWYHWMTDEIGTKLMRTYLDPETAHQMAIHLARFGPTSRPPTFDEDAVEMSTTLWDMRFANVVGLGAGFDKNGEVIADMQRIGFGFVEVSSARRVPRPPAKITAFTILSAVKFHLKPIALF